MIRATAPGKVVLWGEYAVLAGAPALVMAVNRHAVCELSEAGNNWQVSTAGFDAPTATCALADLRSGSPPPAAAIVAAIVSSRPELNWPENLRLDIATDALHHGQHKLGLGSSAAATVAVQAACAHHLGAAPDLQHAQAAHHALQGGRGSGLDVAAAFLGGLVRFQSGQGAPADVALPPHLFIWVGEPAATVDHLRRFEQYQERAATPCLTALAHAATALFTDTSLPLLAEYASCLAQLDTEAGLGIYSPAHSHIAGLASASHLVYKPCGAGGGDLGVVFACSPDALTAFAKQVEQAGFTVMQLESSDHGVQVST